MTIGAVLLAAFCAGPPARWPVANASTTTTYTATETIPVPPASNYAGAGGGDGWSIALSNTQVFNVFHHDSLLQVSCHNQIDATPCYPVRTITDGSGNNFVTSGHPGLFLDENTGKLYVYVNRPLDSTAGVVCVDTTVAAVNPNPFCGYTALTAVNDGPPCCGWGGLSNPVQFGTRLYAYNFVNNSVAAGGSGGQNTLLCFDLTTFAACAGPPIIVNIGAGTVAAGSPTPAIAGIGAQIVIPVVTGGNPLLACWDASTGANCSGSWPAVAPINYPGNAGAPFAELDPTGKLIGLCLPTGTDQCYSLTGASVATPPGMTAAIGSGSVSWDGTGLVLGPRVYVPAWTNVVYCYDSSTSASCANFPKSFTNLSLLYTVNPDPRRPTCIWVNADNGSAQIQNFDAYTGGACGSGPIRVLASSIVVPTQLCTPFTYTSLQVLSPAPSSYTSGTVGFEDTDGNPIPGIPMTTLDATGTVSLAGLSLNTALGLPEFLITLTGASTRPMSVTVELTWTGISDPSCIPAGAPVPTVTGVSPNSGSVGGGTSVTISGSGFTGVTAVKFGSDPATSFTTVSSTSITAVSPPEPPATVDITVGAGSVTSSVSSSDRFTFAVLGGLTGKASTFHVKQGDWQFTHTLATFNEPAAGPFLPGEYVAWADWGDSFFGYERVDVTAVGIGQHTFNATYQPPNAQATPAQQSVPHAFCFTGTYPVTIVVAELNGARSALLSGSVIVKDDRLGGPNCNWGDLLIAQGPTATGPSSLQGGSCSATLVQSTTSLIVLTAAHCFQLNSDGSLVTPIFMGFVADARPLPLHGAFPFAIWTSKDLFIDPKYGSTHGSKAYDFAFAKLSGECITSVEGGSGSQCPRVGVGLQKMIGGIPIDWQADVNGPWLAYDPGDPQIPSCQSSASKTSNSLFQPDSYEMDSACGMDDSNSGVIVPVSGAPWFEVKGGLASVGSLLSASENKCGFLNLASPCIRGTDLNVNDGSPAKADFQNFDQ